MMEMRKVTINDETVEYYLDDERIMRADYTALGWSGLDVVEASMERIAEILEIDFVEDEDEDADTEGEDDEE